MKLRRRLSSSLRALVAYRLRTILALSGVAVGVAAVIVARAVGDGAQKEMTRTVESMGTNLLVIKPLQVKRPVFRPRFSGLATTLTPGDFEAICALPFVASAAPALEGKVRVKMGGRAVVATLRGTAPQFLPVRNFVLSNGRMFDSEDESESRRVVVLGARINRELGHGRSLVGQTVRIGTVPFDVIGVLQEKGTTPDGANEDDQILVPADTALRRVFNQHWLTAVYARVTEPDKMDQAEAQIEATLRERHGSKAGADDFAVQNTAKVRAFQQEMTASLSNYATWLAGIALLIGGLGIMALMFISVRERTGEIGLRIAVGAEPSDILLQFLIESGALALAGWLAGCALGGLSTLGVAFGSSLPLALPVRAVLLSFGTTVVIGLLFGVLPARAAAKIPPIQALLKP
jgi:putative ABC transport system permease protein